MTDTQLLDWIERNEAMLSPEIAENGLCIGWFCHTHAIGHTQGQTPRAAVESAANAVAMAGNRSFAPQKKT